MRFTDFYLKEENSVIYSDEFKNWFGDWENDADTSSKVVDKSGTPLIVYHGTSEKFDTFDKNKIGKNHWQSRGGSNDPNDGAIFFTDKKNSASHYAGKSGNVVKAYLNIKNPLTESSIDYFGAVDKYDLNPSYYVKRAIENGHDGTIISSPNGSLYIVFNEDQIKIIK
jgi:hypothetical protein